MKRKRKTKQNKDDDSKTIIKSKKRKVNSPTSKSPTSTKVKSPSSKSLIFLLRGVNVAGARPLPMKKLKECIGQEFGEELISIQSYIQSGNLIIKTPLPSLLSLSELESKIAKIIFNNFGYDDIPVVGRTIEELQFVLENFPKGERWTIEAENKMHCQFFKTEIPLENASFVDQSLSPEYPIEIHEKYLYLNGTKGYANCKFTPKYLESKLKTSITGRSLKTIKKLIEMGKES